MGYFYTDKKNVRFKKGGVEINNIINLPDKQKKKELPTNVIKVDPTKTVRIPILGRMYEIDGELYYEIQGDPPRGKEGLQSHEFQLK